MLKVKWYKSPYKLNEIPQKTGIVFSFLSAPRDGSIQCHPWVKCRDYLHDTIRSTLTGEKFEVYGFKYGPKLAGCVPADLRRMRMMVSQGVVMPSKSAKAIADFDIKMRYAKKLINYYEKVAGIGYTKLSKHSQDGKNYWAFNGPSFWIKSPALVSMFTFLVRLGDKKLEFNNDDELLAAYKKLGATSTGDNDANYIVSCGTKLRHVVENAKKTLIGSKGFDSDFYAKIDVHTFHNQGGILSLCKNGYINKEKAAKITK